MLLMIFHKMDLLWIRGKREANSQLFVLGHTKSSWCLGLTLALAGLSDCPKCKLLELQGYTFFTLCFPEGNDLILALPFCFLAMRPVQSQQSYAPCLGRRSLNPWTTREVPSISTFSNVFSPTRPLEHIMYVLSYFSYV